MTRLDEIERAANFRLDTSHSNGERTLYMDILALAKVARAAEKDHTQHGRLKRMDKCEVCKALAPLLEEAGPRQETVPHE